MFGHGDLYDDSLLNVSSGHIIYPKKIVSGSHFRLPSHLDRFDFLHYFIYRVYLKWPILVLSLLVNFTLIALILKSRRKDFGAYRFLLLTFATVDIYYALVHYVVMPVGSFERQGPKRFVYSDSWVVGQRFCHDRAWLSNRLDGSVLSKKFRVFQENLPFVGSPECILTRLSSWYSISSIDCSQSNG